MGNFQYNLYYCKHILPYGSASSTASSICTPSDIIIGGVKAAMGCLAAVRTVDALPLRHTVLTTCSSCNYSRASPCFPYSLLFSPVFHVGIISLQMANGVKSVDALPMWAITMQGCSLGIHALIHPVSPVHCDKVRRSLKPFYTGGWVGIRSPNTKQ